MCERKWEIPTEKRKEKWFFFLLGFLNVPSSIYMAGWVHFLDICVSSVVVTEFSFTITYWVFYYLKGYSISMYLPCNFQGRINDSAKGVFR